MTSDAIIVASKWTLNSNISYLSYKALITYVPGVYCLYMALWRPLRSFPAKQLDL